MRRSTGWAAVLMMVVCLGWPPRAAAQSPATAPTDTELDIRCQMEMRLLQSHGQQEAAEELKRQYQAFLHDETVHRQVVTETVERITQAQQAFERYYQQLVAEGDQTGADRMRQLFEISLRGAPLPVRPGQSFLPRQNDAVRAN